MTSPFKKTLILFGVLILLFGVILLSNYYSEKREKEVVKEPSLSSFHKENVKKIILGKNDNFVTLEKQEENWMVHLDENTSYPAKNDDIELGLNKLEEMETESIVSRNKTNHKNYELTEESASKLTITDKNENTLIDLYIGKRSPGFLKQYIRSKGKNEVILVNTNVDIFKNPDKNFWRDPGILKIPKEKISLLALKTPEIKYVFQNTASGFILSEPEVIKVEDSNAPKFEDIIDTLTALNAQSFVDDKNFTEYELDPGQEKMKIYVQTFDETEYTLYLGKRDEETSITYVRKEGSDTIFQLGNMYADKFLNIKLEELRK